MAEQILQSILHGTPKRPTLVSASSPAEQSEYQAFSFGRVGIKAIAMIGFVNADGHHLVLPYLDLRSIQSIEPSLGFDLKFPEWKITVVGRNLATPFRHIREHRLAELIELERHAALNLPEDEPVVIEMRCTATVKSAGF